MRSYQNIDLKQAMSQLDLDINSYQDCKRYAGLLESGSVDRPKSLDQLFVSRNGLCEWYGWKDFVNYYKHGLNFAAVSRLFENPLPLGYQIIYEEWDEHNPEMERKDGSFDSRDKMVAKMEENHYVVVKVDPEYVSSGKYRIITAYYADKATVEEAKRKRLESGSDELFQALVRINDAKYDYFRDLPDYSGDMTKFSVVYSYYRCGEYSEAEVANRLMKIDSSLSVQQADKIARSWLENKNIEFLKGQMNRAFG